MRKHIALISDCAVIVTAVVVCFVVLSNYFRSPSPESAFLKVGDTLASPELLGSGTEHSRRLLLVLKKGCQFCEGSAPLYRELAQLARSGRTSVKMLAVFEEAFDVAKGVMDAEGIDIQVVGGVPLAKLRVGGTPTLVLLDDRGRVLRVWEGILSRKAEDEMKAVIASDNKSCLEWDVSIDNVHTRFTESREPAGLTTDLCAQRNSFCTFVRIAVE